MKAEVDKDKDKDKASEDKVPVPTGPTQDFVVEGRPVAPGGVPAGDTRPFRLRKGMKHYVGGDKGFLREGDTIHYTKAQAEAFADKVEPIDEGDQAKDEELKELRDKVRKLESERGVPSTMPTEPIGPTSSIPQDISARTPANKQKVMRAFETDEDKAAREAQEMRADQLAGGAGSSEVDHTGTAVTTGGKHVARETGGDEGEESKGRKRGR